MITEKKQKRWITAVDILLILFLLIQILGQVQFGCFSFLDTCVSILESAAVIAFNHMIANFILGLIVRIELVNDEVVFATLGRKRLVFTRDEIEKIRYRENGYKFYIGKKKLYVYKNIHEVEVVEKGSVRNDIFPSDFPHAIYE